MLTATEGFSGADVATAAEEARRKIFRRKVEERERRGGIGKQKQVQVLEEDNAGYLLSGFLEASKRLKEQNSQLLNKKKLTLNT